MTDTISSQIQSRILITGETAGTGTSTASKLLAKLLTVPTLSGGKFQRALAFDFKDYCDKNPSLTPKEQYAQFLANYHKAYTNGLEAVNPLFEQYLEEKPQSDIAAMMQAAIEAEKDRTGKVDPIWDYIIDQNTIKLAFTHPGFIWDSKLAILVLNIEQLQEIIPQEQVQANAPFKVLLTVDPTIAAQRVSERESRSVEIEEILLRKKRDFDRYGSIYSINNKKVQHEDLKKQTNIVIDTSKITPDQVVAQILREYKEFIGNTSDKFELVNQINQALTTFTF